MITKLLDPMNRLYRNRVSTWIAESLKNTFVTPNLLTFAHTLVGVTAAVLIYFSHYILAVGCFEIRTLVDSADGILARLKNESSSLGRILDTIGDGISFNALMIAGAMRMIQDFPTYRPSIILIIVFCFAMTAAHCGIIYQLMKRKITSILTKEVDTVEKEWREHWMKVHSGHPGRLDRFGLWLDSFTIRFISEEWYEKLQRRLHRTDWDERALNDAVMMNELARTTRRRELRNAIRCTALLSDDNIFAIMSIIFLVLGFFPVQIFPYVHPVLIAFCAGFIYAIISLLCALHFFHDFYHGVYRE